MAEQQKQTSGTATSLEYEGGDEFAALLRKEFKPNDDKKQKRIELAVQTLAAQALAEATVTDDDVFATVDKIKSALDQKLTEQINKILHHKDFQQMEAAWRGLHYLVTKTPTSKNLKIRVLNISKDETRKILRQYQGVSWDQSPLFKKLYEAEFDQLGGHPFGAVVCDYYFDHSGPDIDIMRGLTKIGAAAHAPFIAGTSPTMLGMETWQEISNPRDLAKLLEATDYSLWRSFRDSQDSRYLALTLPRFLGRRLYGAKSEPVEGFAFEEDTEGGKHDKFLWLNASYALAVRITSAFDEWGWCTRIRGVEAGGTVDNLPQATFPTSDHGFDEKCPTEVAISERRENELSSAGFMSLIHRKNTTQATFIGAQTVHAPERYEDPEATKNANLSARLPYIFASCRFAHYLKCMVRDWIGRSLERDALESELRTWVLQYVDGQPKTSTEETKARKPLKAADVALVDDEENPGRYKGVFRFVPHYQFEGADVSLSLVARLPHKK
jgi:type VI secretion system protein ImpC